MSDITNDPCAVRLVVEAQPSAEHVAFLEDNLYAFNSATTGIRDANLLGVFLQDRDGALRGGAYGWTWGKACYVRYFFVATELRCQGYGTQLMHAVEAIARARGCVQIVLETHDFQAPEFYRTLGFEVTGIVDGYPQGHQYLTLVKRLAIV